MRERSVPAWTIALAALREQACHMPTTINQSTSTAADTQQVRPRSNARWVADAVLTPAEQHALRRSTALSASRSRPASQQARSLQ
jgi:hypothetical protein